MVQQSFAVDGLHCGGCISTVSEVLSALPEVKAVNIILGDGTPSTVQIDTEAELTADQIQSALDARGTFQVQR